MTAVSVITVHWRALDRAGEDTCRLSQLDGGRMLVGHARFRDDTGWSALDYVLRCGPDWLTTSADVSGTHGEARIALNIRRNGTEWTVNDAPAPTLTGATDIDLGFTPATNLMPLRRLSEIGRLSIRAAWLRAPDLPLEPLDQSYTRERGHLVRYRAEATGADTQLEVDANGFVTHYPGLWQADHAP